METVTNGHQVCLGAGLVQTTNGWRGAACPPLMQAHAPFLMALNAPPQHCPMLGSDLKHTPAGLSKTSQLCASSLVQISRLQKQPDGGAENKALHELVADPNQK